MLPSHHHGGVDDLQAPAMNHSQEEFVYDYEYREVTIESSSSSGLTRLFGLLVRGFIVLCIISAILSFFTWLVFRPQTIQVAVTTATLARFHLNTTSTPSLLSYNLSAVMAISNPNTRVSVYYDQLEAAGSYQDEPFGDAVLLPESFQGTRHTDAVPAVLVGSSPAMDISVDEFRADSSAGVFPVDLWVDGSVRYKYGELITSPSTKLKVKCYLELKLMVAPGWVQCTIIDGHWRI